MEKKELSRLFKKAVDYILDCHLVETQQDLAKLIGVTPASLSKTKNGRYSPDQSAVRKMNEAFGGIFNMDFFRGESDVMLVADLREKPRADFQIEKAFLEERISMLREKVSDKEETIASLKRELATADGVIRSMRQQIDDLRSLLHLDAEKKMTAGPRKGKDTGPTAACV